MAGYAVQTFKLWQGQKWSNRYLLNAADRAAATGACLTIMEAERAILNQQVQVSGGRVSSILQGDEDYVTVPFGQFGLDQSNTGLLPMFCCIRVDFMATGGGRPSRKYWKGYLDEGQVHNGIIQQATLTIVENIFTTLLTDLEAASATLVDPDGQVLGSPTAYPQVQMRQMHRKRRKRVAES